MKNISVQLNGKKVPGLIIEKNEWNQLNKLISDADVKKAKQIDRQNKLIIKTTKRNEIRHKEQLEKIAAKQKKFLDDIEAEHQIRDKIRNQEILEKRNKINKNLQLNIWSNKDSTKMIQSEVYKMQVLKERNLQIEFDKAERMKTQEKECLLKMEQNAEAEKYRKDKLEQKKKQAEIKKANNAILLNELKIREDLSRNEILRLKNEGIAEVQLIKQEIEKNKKEEQAKIQAKKKIMEQDHNENRRIVAMKTELRQLEELNANTAVAKANELKKRVYKLIKLKEIKMKEEKQELFEKFTEKTKKNLRESSEKLKMEDHYNIEENEQKYQEEKLQKEELIKKRRKISEDNKKMFEEKDQKEKERLTLSRRWEQERRQRENKMLCDLEQLHKEAKINETNNYRKILNDQCATKQAIKLDNLQAERKDYDALIKLWHQDEAEFTTYTKSIIDKYAKDGVTVVPLLKAIKEYTANSRK